jgi:L-lactate dehydrogenase complex protein LldE
MRISLLVPCFVNQYFPHAAMAMVDVLERLGHDVDCPESFTCCGQPPFNSGFWSDARPVTCHALEVFADADVVVGGSGSCVSMMKVFSPELLAGKPQEKLAREVAAKTYEFSDFLVNVLKVTDVGARFKGTVTFHDGCHGLRELGIKKQARELLKNVRDLTLVEMGEAETCCGFGGTFAVKFPMISTSMGEVKCASICATGAEYVISNDSSCLMQIQGLLDKQGKPVKSIHLAEVLASR